MTVLVKPLTTLCINTRGQNKVKWGNFVNEEKAIGEQADLSMQLQESVPSIDEAVPIISSQNVFRRNETQDRHRNLLRKHKAWLELIQHEYPMPYKHYRIGVYIRYFNQTKYENYLDYHKQQFADTIALCPNWELIDFYVDEGISAPNMESAKDWCRLLDDCFAGKIDLIITQKVSNVSRKPSEIAFIARILAAQRHPVGMYFISEDLFTLASYYQTDLHEKYFLPVGWEVLPDSKDEVFRLKEGESVE